MNPNIPFLNKNVFQLVDRGDSKTPITDREDVSKAIKELACYLKPYTKHTTNVIAHHLKRHLFVNHQYRKDLQKDICLLHDKWKSLIPDEQTAVADKILQGLKSCTKGFYNRIKDAVLALQDDFTIPYMLQVMRHDIVVAAAYGYLKKHQELRRQTVHHLPAFLSAAAPVYNLGDHQPDKYSNLTAKTILPIVRAAMDIKYQPLPIFFHILEQLEIKLRTEYGYKDRCENSTIPYDTGLKIHEAIVQLLLCQNNAIDFMHLFIVEEETFELIDINWPFLRFYIYQKLSRCFSLSEQQENCLEYLINPDAQYDDSLSFKSLRNTENSVNIIQNSKNLAMMFNIIPEEKQQRLFDVLKDTFENKINFYQQLFQNATDHNIASHLLADIIQNLTHDERAVLCNKNLKSLVTMLSALRNFDETEQNQRLLLEAFLQKLPNSSKRIDAIISLYFNERCQELDLKDQLKDLFNEYTYINNISSSISKAIKQKQIRKVEFYLECAKKLPPGTQAKILKQTDNAENNCVSLIMCASPAAIKPMLQVIIKLPLEEQEEILQQANTQGFNPLMQIVDAKKLSIEQSDIELLLQCISKFSDKAKTNILTQTDMQNGQNVLMIALKALPNTNLQTIQMLLAAISELRVACQRIIFQEQTITLGGNSLMLAAKNGDPRILRTIMKFIGDLKLSDQIADAIQTAVQHNLENASPLLKFIKKLPPATLADILKRTNHIGRNILMLLLIRRSLLLRPLFTMLEDLGRKDKTEILKQIDTKKNNSIHIMIHAYPEAITPILRMAAELPLEERAKILQQANSQGLTPLMMAINSKAFPVEQSDIELLLIHCIGRLPVSTKVNILTNSDKVSGQNVLMKALCNNTAFVELLIKILQELPAGTQIKVLKHTDNQGNNVCLLAAASNNTEMLQMILMAVFEFISSPQQIGEILSHCNKVGNNILMTALEKLPDINPEIIRMVLNATNSLPPDYQTRLFRQTNKVLIMAPETLSKIDSKITNLLLRAICRLPVQCRGSIFQEKNLFDNNILMIALKSTPKVNSKFTRMVVQAVSQLPVEYQSNIFQERNKRGNNALMTALIALPNIDTEIIRKLFDAIGSLPIYCQNRIFKPYKYNTLTPIMQHKPELVPDLIKVISKLCVATQVNIITFGIKFDAIARFPDSTFYTGLIEAYLDCLNGSLINNKDKAITFAHECGLMLQYMSDSLRGDVDVVLSALTNDPNTLRFANDQLRENNNLIAISQISSRSERESAIENYIESSDYKRERTISNLVKVLKSIHSKSGIMRFFSPGKNRNKKEQKAVKKVIDILNGKDETLSCADIKVLDREPLRRILREYPNLTPTWAVNSYNF